MRPYIYLGAAILLNSASYVFYKYSCLSSAKRLVSVLLLLAGLVLGAANATLYTKSLKGLGLNTAYPIFSALSLVLVTVLSLAVFGEAISARKLLGLAILVVGVVVVAA